LIPAIYAAALASPPNFATRYRMRITLPPPQYGANRRPTGMRTACRLAICWAVAASTPTHAELVSQPAATIPLPESTLILQLASDADPQAIADATGMRYGGPLAGLPALHRFFAPQPEATPTSPPGTMQPQRQSTGDLLAAIAELPGVLTAEPDAELRVEPHRIPWPTDPVYRAQWHLENLGQRGGARGIDLAAPELWAAGLTGRGTNVAVIDTGIDFRHRDLAPNYIDGSARDFFRGDMDPSPEFADDGHGTAVAGIILAARNGVDGQGLAYESGLVPIRYLSGGETSTAPASSAAEALVHRLPDVAVYNNSWGNIENYTPLSSAVAAAMNRGVSEGRNGRGVVFVWSAGNGGDEGRNSNYRPHANHPTSLAVGAIGNDGWIADYSEPGANVLLVAPSRGATGPGITTTDPSGANGYTSGTTTPSFSGTSAAAPMVAAAAALVLQAQPDLHWNDVYELLARTARMPRLPATGLQRNGVGLLHHPIYGFGLVNPAAAVQLAKQWPVRGNHEVSSSHTGIVSPTGDHYAPGNSELSNPNGLLVRAVQVTLNLPTTNWRGLRIELTSPAGTVSVLHEPHELEQSGPTDRIWTFLSNRPLGENSAGFWQLRVRNANGSNATVTSWSLRIHGVPPALFPNRAPLAADLLLSTSGQPLTIAPLAGASDPDGDPLQLLWHSQPLFGDLAPSGANQFTYTPPLQPVGANDHFAVFIADGRGGVRQRIIQIVDDRPRSLPDQLVQAAGQSFGANPLANDSSIFSPLQLDAGDGALRNLWLLELPLDAPRISRFPYEIVDTRGVRTPAWLTVYRADDEQRALDFNGRDSEVEISSSAPQWSIPSPFTIEAWIRPTSYGEISTGFGRIFDRSNLSFFLCGPGHAFYNPGSLVLYFVLGDGSTTTSANTPADSITLNRWHKVSAVWNRNDSANPVRIYIDGVLQPLTYPITGSQPPRLALQADSTGSARIGENAAGTRAFHGAITEFRLWSAAHTEATIVANLDRRLSGSEPNLLLHLPLNQGAGSEFFSQGSVAARAVARNALWRPFETLEDVTGPVFSAELLQPDGWQWLFGYGWVFADLFPWVFRDDIGWMYLQGSDPDHWWWSPATGWLYSTPAIAPWHIDPSGSPRFIFESQLRP
jgi:subtilisin family serine protease